MDKEKKDTAVIVITSEGLNLGGLVAEELGASLHVRKGVEQVVGSNIEVESFTKLSEHVRKIFYEYRGLVFVMSLGIVNRVIAPCMKDKYSDPAVVTIDEVGRYVISTLSGHEGGANELAYLVSSITGADPVVTTATEANRLYTCGVGCKKGEDGKKVLAAIKTACAEAGISPEELRCLASAWVKRKEQAISYAAKQLNLYTRFIPKWLIDFYYESHPQASRSAFVFSKIGVYGVAEPCAMLSGRNTKLLLCKNYNGVKVALARENLIKSICLRK